MAESKQVTVEAILERNKTYAESAHQKLPPILDLFGGDLKGNSPNIVCVSCLDPRVNPDQVLGFGPFDAFFLRNVSGRITPALNDIASLDSVMHFNQVIVMHHTNCGATHGTADQLRDDLKAAAPGLSKEEVDDVVRHSPLRADDDSALKADLKTLRDCKFLRKDLTEGAWGFYCDTATGLVSQVSL